MFEGAILKLTADSRAAATVAVLKGEAILKRRVFRERKATDQSSLGPYFSESWKKKRQSKGRQTGVKDLFFNGDLFRSITKGEDDKGNVVLGFSRERQREIAGYQEEYLRKPIFRFSADELQEIKRAFIEELKRRNPNARIERVG